MMLFGAFPVLLGLVTMAINGWFGAPLGGPSLAAYFPMLDVPSHNISVINITSMVKQFARPPSAPPSTVTTTITAFAEKTPAFTPTVTVTANQVSPSTVTPTTALSLDLIARPPTVSPFEDWLSRITYFDLIRFGIFCYLAAKHGKRLAHRLHESTMVSLRIALAILMAILVAICDACRRPWKNFVQTLKYAKKHPLRTFLTVGDRVTPYVIALWTHGVIALWTFACLVIRRSLARIPARAEALIEVFHAVDDRLYRQVCMQMKVVFITVGSWIANFLQACHRRYALRVQRREILSDGHMTLSHAEFKEIFQMDYYDIMTLKRSLERSEDEYDKLSAEFAQYKLQNPEAIPSPVMMEQARRVAFASPEHRPSGPRAPPAQPFLGSRLPVSQPRAKLTYFERPVTAAENLRRWNLRNSQSSALKGILKHHMRMPKQPSPQPLMPRWSSPGDPMDIVSSPAVPARPFYAPPPQPMFS
ncbi:hypothetical protein NX059_005244 [Plenodomus lindquistii]|nr:hypothetical protein NX059_005244 [Plenodomus lindquistii]